MNPIEKQIIDLINANRYFSEDLKKRYIVAMFLMEYEKQEEYLKLIQAFGKKCEEMDRGIFIVHPNEMGTMLRTYDQAKADILKKLNVNPINNNPTL
jgi:predicted aldo/keto reductase-like oxidoreductase